MAIETWNWADSPTDLLRKLVDNVAVSATGDGNIVGPASSTNNALAVWDGVTGKLLKNSDLTYSTPTLTTPDGFNISSAGEIKLTAGGTNKNITLTPSGTGTTVLGVATELNGASAAGMFPFIIGRSGGSANMAIVAYGSNASLRGFGVQGTPGAVSATTNGQTLLNILGCGYDSSNTWVSSTAFIQFQAQEAYTSAARGTRIDFGTTAIGASGSATRATIFNNGLFQIGKASVNTAAWGTGGVIFSTQANTWTDNSSATGTVASAVFNSFAAPTINATNASVVYTNLANVYIAGDVATTGNASATNSYGLWNVGKTRLDGTAAAGALPSGATTTGFVLTTPAQTFTVTGTNTATAHQSYYFGAPTFTDASAGTITDAFNANFIAPGAAGGSLVITRKHTVGILDATSAASSITGGFIVAATYGTTATSVGIGGGNVNAGGTITSGGLITSGAGITYTGILIVSTDTLSGAGAVSVTKDTTKLTSSGVGQAITLANGVDGQIKRIIHDVDGGSMILTPATKTGWSTATFTNAGDSLTLEYATTRGWFVLSSYGTVVAP